VTVHLRFVPGFADAHLDWPVLRDELPHCDATKRLSGGWRTFLGELKQAALVTLLYLPEKYSGSHHMNNDPKNSTGAEVHVT
jgi:hypothetical protein